MCLRAYSSADFGVANPTNAELLTQTDVIGSVCGLSARSWKRWCPFMQQMRCWRAVSPSGGVMGRSEWILQYQRGWEREREKQDLLRDYTVSESWVQTVENTYVAATYLLLLITTSTGNGHLGTLKSPFHLFRNTLSEKLSLSFEEVLEFKSMITRLLTHLKINILY